MILEDIPELMKIGVWDIDKDELDVPNVLARGHLEYNLVLLRLFHIAGQSSVSSPFKFDQADLTKLDRGNLRVLFHQIEAPVLKGIKVLFSVVVVLVFIAVFVQPVSEDLFD